MHRPPCLVKRVPPGYAVVREKRIAAMMVTWVFETRIFEEVWDEGGWIFCFSYRG